MNKDPATQLRLKPACLGGINFPESATAIKSSMEVGKSEKVIFVPCCTLFSNSSNPLIPPTNSILLSVRGSPDRTTFATFS